MVCISGQRVHPASVSQKICAHPRVLRAFFVPSDIPGLIEGPQTSAEGCIRHRRRKKSASIRGFCGPFLFPQIFLGLSKGRRLSQKNAFGVGGAKKSASICGFCGLFLFPQNPQTFAEEYHSVLPVQKSASIRGFCGPFLFPQIFLGLSKGRRLSQKNALGAGGVKKCANPRNV